MCATCSLRFASACCAMFDMCCVLLCVVVWRRCLLVFAFRCCMRVVGCWRLLLHVDCVLCVVVCCCAVLLV